MKVIFHLSASRWAIWRQQYGDHPDVLWRDMKQKFAKAALDKFDLQRNDVDRTATANIEARALTTVRGDGTRAMEMLKDFRLVSNILWNGSLNPRPNSRPKRLFLRRPFESICLPKRPTLAFIRQGPLLSNWSTKCRTATETTLFFFGEVSWPSSEALFAEFWGCSRVWRFQASPIDPSGPPWCTIGEYRTVPPNSGHGVTETERIGDGFRNLKFLRNSVLSVSL